MSLGNSCLSISLTSKLLLQMCVPLAFIVNGCVVCRSSSFSAKRSPLGAQPLTAASTLQTAGINCTDVILGSAKLLLFACRARVGRAASTQSARRWAGAASSTPTPRCRCSSTWRRRWRRTPASGRWAAGFQLVASVFQVQQRPYTAMALVGIVQNHKPDLDVEFATHATRLQLCLQLLGGSILIDD